MLRRRKIRFFPSEFRADSPRFNEPILEGGAAEIKSGEGETDAIWLFMRFSA